MADTDVAELRERVLGLDEDANLLAKDLVHITKHLNDAKRELAALTGEEV